MIHQISLNFYKRQHIFPQGSFDARRFRQDNLNARFPDHFRNVLTLLKFLSRSDVTPGNENPAKKYLKLLVLAG